MSNQMEQEIYHFKVPHAEAEFDGNSLVIKLFYPRNALEEIEGRLQEQLDFGINVFEQLLSSGRALIADKEHPLKPSAGGSLCILADNVIACHRRDKGAGVHPMYHGASGGYTSSREFTTA